MNSWPAWGVPPPPPDLSAPGPAAGPADAPPADDEIADVDQSFRMRIEGVFTITGRGTVVTGRVERGRLGVDQEVEIVGAGEKVTRATVTAMEAFHKTTDLVQAGDDVSLALRGTERREVERGDVVVRPGFDD